MGSKRVLGQEGAREKGCKSVSTKGYKGRRERETWQDGDRVREHMGSRIRWHEDTREQGQDGARVEG